MLNDINDEITCQICYESSSGNDFVTFDGCNHKFCKLCTLELTIHEPLICPLDRKICRNVIMRNDNNIDISKSIPAFQYEIAMDHRDLLNETVELGWDHCLRYCSKLGKLFIESLSKYKTILENWLRHENWGTEDDIKNFQNSLETIKYKLWPTGQTHSKDNRFTVVRDEDIKAFLMDVKKSKNMTNKIAREPFIPDRDTALFDIVRNNSLKGTCEYCSKITKDMDNMEDLMKMFNCQSALRNIVYSNVLSHIDDKLLLQCFLEDIRRDITNIGMISRRITSRIVFNVNDNRKLYSIDSPGMNRTDEDKCLICTESIDKTSGCATFLQCHHKICLYCIDKYRPTEASCPFDGTQLTGLVVCQKENGIKKSISEYLESTHEQVKYSRIESLIVFTKQLIAEVFVLARNTEGVFEDVKLALHSRKRDKKVLIINNVIKVMLNIWNNQYIFNPTISTFQMSMEVKTWITKKDKDSNIFNVLIAIHSKCVAFLTKFLNSSYHLSHHDTFDQKWYMQRLSATYGSFFPLSTNIAALNKCQAEFNMGSLGELIEDMKELDSLK